MYCPNCGANSKDGAQFCENCGAPLQTYNGNPNMNYSNNMNYNQGYQQAPFMVSKEVEKKFTTLLICCILELVCCNQIFGGIALVFAILGKNALSSGDIAKYEKDTKTAKTILIVGVILSLVCGILYTGFFGFSILAEL